MSYLKGLECKECGTCYPADRSFVFLECFGSLEVSYDYSKIQSQLNPKIISQREPNLWRYRELLPVIGEPISGFPVGVDDGYDAHIHARGQLGEKGADLVAFIADDDVKIGIVRMR